MKELIKVKGTAKNVFSYIELMNKHNGNVTLGELAKKNKTTVIDLRK